MTIRSMLLALTVMTLAALGAPAAAKCVLQKVAEMPVTMVGLRPVINAKINGVDVRLFIDTGSFANTINPGVAARIGLRLESLPPYFQVQGLTGNADMHLTTAREFTIMGVPFHRAEFLVAEHSLGADGLIGESMLSKFDVEWDLANGVVRLFLPKDCGSANLAYWSNGSASFIPIKPIEPPNNSLIGQAKVNGATIHVQFDTGTPRSTLTVAAARRAGVRTDAPGVVAAGGTIGVGHRIVETWLAPFDSFEIGGETVKGTKLRFADLQMGDAEMMIGADFFLSHHIYISRSQDRLYFTYNGGPVFNLEQGGAAATGPPVAPATAAGLPDDAPKTADDFSRRAAAAVARHEFEEAIAEYSQAIALAPADAQAFYGRATTRIMNHQPLLAVSDLDEALRLKPDLVPALMMRGDMRLVSKDEPGAQADFAAAMKADPTVALRIADAYARAGRYEMAILDFDSWISSQPRNEDLAGALAARCRARAMLGVELDKALGDCNDAIHYRPEAMEYRAARGLVRLRLGQLDPAISDFDAVLHAQAKAPWALYGRGVAELRKGDKEKGEADIAAAAAVAPRLADQAAKVGIKP